MPARPTWAVAEGWTEINKGDKEIKKDKREDPIRGDAAAGEKNPLVSLWASVPGTCLDFGDVVRTYFHARAKRRARVELSNEYFKEGKGGLLKKATHGTRETAGSWELE